jgi:hypothetical protein
MWPGRAGECRDGIAAQEARGTRTEKLAGQRLDCAPGRIRTCDTRFRKPLLYPLSYEGSVPAGPDYAEPRPA